jgi:hypothetical protein
MESKMAGTSKSEDLKPDDLELPASLPELLELDPVPEDGSPTDHGEPSPDDVPYVPPPGTQ